MATLAVRFSEEPVVTLPAELAHRAGLEEGAPVEVMVTAEGLLLTPMTDYAQAWRTLEERLDDQAVELGLAPSDDRDEAYWQIVDPMFQELERDLPS